MKKRTVLGVAVSIAAIALLLALGAYLAIETEQANQKSSSALEEPFSFSTEAEQPASPSGAASGTDDQTARALASARGNTPALPEHHVIFVGDSRTVAMGEAEADLGDACDYIGATGEGYSWFAETGIGQMEDAMALSPSSPVVLNLGVNDPDMITHYLDLYRTFSDRYPDTAFYFLSVNPVTEESKHVSNPEIAEFNDAIRSAFPDQYLDSYSYLRALEFESVDGVHYSEETSRDIHDFVVKQLF